MGTLPQKAAPHPDVCRSTGEWYDLAMLLSKVKMVGLLLLVWLAGAACTPQTAVSLPTRIPLAAIPTQTPIPPTANPNFVPPTWTPAPTTASSTNGENFTIIGTLAPSPTPSNTPIFPTSTPRPTRTPTPTPTIIATPTRYQSYIPNLPPSTDLGPSKLGIHIIRANDQRILDFIRIAQPPVIKALDNFGYLDEVKQVSPRTLIVGRIDTVSQNYSGTPEEAARDFVNEQLDQYLANPAVDYWEGWNEPDPGLEHMGWYARFEQERVRLLAQYGLKAAVGGFATGVPEMNEFALFLPAIATAKEYQGILSLHEYGAPDMTYLYGSALPGYPTYPDRGALTFRYRWYYKEFLIPNDLVIPLAITEAGIDGIIGNRPGPDGYGWQDFQGYWVEQGWADNGVQAFINQLAWYDAGVRQDGYVIGFTVFTAGGHGHWLNYDINDILPQLTAYVVGQQ